jgi:hypothetical protein
MAPASAAASTPHSPKYTSSTCFGVGKLDTMTSTAARRQHARRDSSAFNAELHGCMTWNFVVVDLVDCESSWVTNCGR